MTGGYSNAHHHIIASTEFLKLDSSNSWTSGKGLPLFFFIICNYIQIILFHRNRDFPTP
jgi:hypothetical protein